MIEMESENDDNGSDSPLIIVSEKTPLNNSRKIICTKQQYLIATIILGILCLLFAGLSIYLLIRENVHNKNKSRKNHSVFFQISDTHLDIYYNDSVTSQNWKMCRYLERRNSPGKKGVLISSNKFARFGRAGCDTPRDLLESAAQKMSDLNKELKKPAQFVILSGDQSAHDYSYFQVNAEESVLWSIVNSTQILSEKINIPILMALGNNDLPDDYKPPLNFQSAFYKTLGDSLKPFIFLKGSNVASLNTINAFEATFHLGGFYSLNVTENLIAILLNTNYWNTLAHSLNPNTSIIGDLQIEWFKQQLNLAKLTGKKVIISGHIPPGYSTYKDEATFWLANYTEEYVKTVDNYAALITAQLYGHIHQDKIKVQQVTDTFNASGHSAAKAYVLICPSITPIHGSNPAFRMFTYDKSNLDLKDYTQYFVDFTISNVQNQALWQQEYTFSTLYSKSLDSDSINDLVERLISQENSTWYSYASHMKTLYGGVTLKTIFDEYCSAKYPSIKAFHTCLAYYKPVL